MSFLKKLVSQIVPPSQPASWDYWMAVKCNRCGEVIRTRVNLRNDLSIEYGEGSNEVTYFSRKTIIGNEHCYQPIEVELTFDRNHKLIDRKIKNGQFVEE